MCGGATVAFETSVIFFQITRRHISVDCRIHTNLREKLMCDVATNKTDN
jgi:hypothetical protein